MPEPVTPTQAAKTTMSTIRLVPDKPKKTAADWVRDMRMSPDVNRTTVGVDTASVTGDLLLATSSKLLGISRRKQEPDPKDSLEFQRFYGPAEYFAEHVMRDGNKLGRNILWKATNQGNLDFMPVAALDKHISDVYYDSKLAQMIDGSSPLETVDASYKTTRIGEGGVGDLDSAPEEMRTVQPSFLGFVDPIRCFAKGTQIYTRDGWKNIEQITKEDQVLCYKDHTSYWDNPVDLIQYPFKGELCCYDDGKVAFKVTPNHLLWFHDRNLDGVFTKRKSTDPSWDKYFAEDLYNQSIFVTLSDTDARGSSFYMLEADKWYKAEYDDLVYCLTVPGGLLLARLAGRSGLVISNSPESFRVGLDVYMTKNVMKGSDGKLYQKFINAHTGKEELVDSETLAKSVVTTPEMMKTKTKSVFAMGGPTGVRIVPRQDVDYYLPRADEAYSLSSNMVTMPSAVIGMRLLMGCLHPETNVFVANERNMVSMVKAKYLTAKEQRIPGMDKDYKSVCYGMRNTITKCVPQAKWFKKIVLRSGRVIITSYDHKWPVLIKDKMTLVQARDLRAGDTVFRSSFRDVPNRRTFLNKHIITRDVAFVLGLICRSCYSNHPGSIGFCYPIAGDLRVKDAIQYIYRNLTPKQFHITKKDGFRYMTVKCQELYDFVKENIGLKPEERRIPSEILSGYADIAAEFINGYTSDETKVGIDCNEDIWVLFIPNMDIRDQLAFLFARMGTDTLYRDASQNGELQIALKLSDTSKVQNGMYLDTVKYVWEGPKCPIMVDIDIDDNMYAVANGIVTHNSKYPLQAISLEHREAPLVRTLDEASGKDMAQIAGKFLGARFADRDGIVTAVRKDRIDVMWDDGTKGAVPLYVNFPMNAKGYINNTPVVKAGQSFKAGDCLASSNYTDKSGTAALGINLRSGWISWKGGTYEDAVVISEEAAKKLTSTTMYNTSVDLDKTVSLGKRNYITWKPAAYNKEQMDALDDNGIVKPGTVLHKGDPMILAIRTSEPSPGTMGKRVLTDLSETWDHDHAGIVTDVVKTRKGVKVYTTVTAPAEVGDKIAGLHGNKGTIAQILPADQMPQTQNGTPLDICFSPLGVTSRNNTSQLYEALLAKVAKKTGQTQVVPAFYEGDLHDYVESKLKQARVHADDDLVDPETGRTLPNILTGYTYVHKLKHLAESKMSARGTGEYSADETPAGSGETKAKRFGSLEVGAMVGHSAFENLRDAKLLRGQSNADFWRSIRTGNIPTMPGEPLVHKKFFAHLIGSGVNVRKSQQGVSAFALSSDDVEELTGPRELKTRDTYETKNFRPIDGGLFGQDIFGINGDKWAYIKLDEPVPNPVMEEPLARLLRMPDKTFIGVATGKTEYNGIKGPQQLKEALAKVNLDVEAKNALQELKNAPVSKKDAALKRYVAIERMRRLGVTPDKYMLDKIPVLPPQFRPISTHNGLTMVADSNYLYAQLLDARDDVREAKDLPPEYQQQARETLYKNWKELTGLYEPENKAFKAKHIQGLLKWALGDSPKCHDDATDVLTERGWMPFKDYHGGIRVATVNPLTDEFEWQMPTDVIHGQSWGEMIQIKTRTLDSVVTPNHEYYRARRNKEGSFTSYTKERADSVFYHPNRMQIKTAASHFSGNIPEAPLAVKNLHAFATWVGWFVAEGWCHPDMCTAYVSVKANGRDDAKILSVMEALGVPYKRKVYTTKHDRHSYSYGRELFKPAGYPMVFYSINSKALCYWLKEHVGDKAWAKKLSKTILDWESAYLENLVDGWFWGDGLKCEFSPKKLENRATWKNRKSVSDYGHAIVTTSPYLRDNLQEIGAKIGCQFAEISEADTRNGRKPLYKISLHAFDYSVAEGNKQIQRIEYHGNVHCATVPNGLLITRRNGRVLVSGNSSAAQRKIIGIGVDTVGRGVITPNPRIKLNQVGLPEDMAFGIFSPLVERALVQRGYTPVEAIKQVHNKSNQARELLLKVMETHPVLMNRAPTLHKLSIMAFNPVLVSGHALQINPSIVVPFGADFDGDSISGLWRVSFDLKKIEENQEKLNISGKKFLTFAESGVYCMADTTKKGEHGMFDKSAKVRYSSAICSPSELPIVPGSEVQKSATVTEWDVVTGVYADTMNLDGSRALAQVTKVSRHTNLKMFDVCLSIAGRYKSVVTASDDHSLITLNQDTMELEKTRPEDAVGKLIPRLRQDSSCPHEFCQRYIHFDAAYEADHDLGEFIGIMLGDGWVTTNGRRKNGTQKAGLNATIACCDESLQQEILRLVDIATTKLPVTAPSQVYSYAPDTDRFSKKNSQRINLHLEYNFKEALKSAIGTGAANKHIPSECLRASRAHRAGILVGLLATDGNVTYSDGTTAKQSKSKTILYHTTSTELRDGLVALCYSLGIRTSATPYMGPHSKVTCYAVSLSIVDYTREYDRTPTMLRIPCQKKQDKLERIMSEVRDKKYTSGTVTDIVPFPNALWSEFSWAKLRDAATLCGWKKHGFIALGAAMDFADALRKIDWSAFKDHPHLPEKYKLGHTPEQAQKLITDWCDLVECSSNILAWVHVDKVTPSTCTEGWDCTVPGPYTFALYDGTIVQDTVNIHAPVSDNAREEARRRMFPERNLIAMKNRQIAYKPEKEYLQGLYTASRINDKSAVRPMLFKDLAEARAAFRKGLINIDDPIEIQTT